VITLGSLAFSAGVAWWALAIGLHPNYLSGVLGGMILTGVGVGLTLPTMMATASSSLPPQSFATGSAVVNMIRQAGLALGVAILVAVLGGTHRGTAELNAFRHGWWVIAAHRGRRHRPGHRATAAPLPPRLPSKPRQAAKGEPMEIARSTALVTGANRGLGVTWPSSSSPGAPPSTPGPATSIRRRARREGVAIDVTDPASVAAAADIAGGRHPPDQQRRVVDRRRPPPR